jgi:hypothetical protein
MRNILIIALLLAFAGGARATDEAAPAPNPRSGPQAAAPAKRGKPKLTSKKVAEEEFEVCCSCGGPGTCLTCPTEKGNCTCGKDAGSKLQCAPSPKKPAKAKKKAA